MYNFVVMVHVLICILVTVVILMQSGRGGGLTEGFASAESMFGAKTNSFMIKTTTVLTILFFILSLFLAVISAQRTDSMMPTQVAIPQAAENAEVPSEESLPVDAVEGSLGADQPSENSN